MKKLFNDDDFDSSLEESGVYLLNGEIDSESCGEAIRWILEQNISKTNEKLTLVICSEGGCVHSGFALIDTILGSKIPVRTVGLGLIASMGLSIFISGKKGERLLTPNTLILSHQWSGVNFGKEHELLAYQKANCMVSEMIMAHYRKHTKLPRKLVEKHLLPPSDVYLSAQEAKKLGVCDIVKEFNGA